MFEHLAGPSLLFCRVHHKYYHYLSNISTCYLLQHHINTSFVSFFEKLLEILPLLAWFCSSLLVFFGRSICSYNAYQQNKHKNIKRPHRVYSWRVQQGLKMYGSLIQQFFCSRNPLISQTSETPTFVLCLQPALNDKFMTTATYWTIV
jgi:hypothetical protein